MNNELVSIIVPVYNVEHYLNECVDSLLSQTYKNIEVILVDDGSNDNSGKICEQYADKEPNIIKVIHKENEGLGFARNSGLDIARGKYVTFIDSDDIAESDMISRLIETIQDKKADTCIGGFRRMTDSKQIIYYEQYEAMDYVGNDVYETLFARMLGSSPVRSDSIRMSVWNVMYSMDIIKTNNLRFPSERVLISEDIVWDIDYYKYAKKVCVIDSTAYNYRVNPNSLTQKYKQDRLEKCCDLYNYVEDKLNGDGEKIVRWQRQFLVYFRLGLRQERKNISQKSISEIVKTINTALNMPVIRKIVDEYPRHLLGIKQRFFVLLVKNKATFILYFFIATKII